MDSTSPSANRSQEYQQELVERIAGAVGEEQYVEPLPGLVFHRETSAAACSHGVTVPSFCVIAQGSKEILAGDERYRYDPANYLLTTVEFPYVGQVLEATEEKPYLSIRIDLSPTLVSSVMVEAGHPAAGSDSSARGIAVSRLDASLFEAVVRLVRLVDSPDDAAFLDPLIRREIVYRLLVGEQGDRLRHIAVLGGETHRIARAIALIRDNFDQAIQIEDIARELAMSTSSFHHHFKSVTTMTPLQFQKKLRLQTARRLMLAEHLDAATAGFRVGYNDASHFSREYKRLFGEPPMRDIEQLREQASADAGC